MTTNILKVGTEPYVQVLAGHPKFYSSLSRRARPSTLQFYTAKTAKRFSGQVRAWVRVAVWAARVLQESQQPDPGLRLQSGHPEFYSSLSRWAQPSILQFNNAKLLSSLVVWSGPGLGLQFGHPEFHSSLSSHVLGWGRRLGTHSFIAVLVAGPSSPQTGAVRC